MSKDAIRLIQAGLIALGYDLGRGGADGWFGNDKGRGHRLGWQPVESR